MPLYTFECEKCHEEFQEFSDSDGIGKKRLKCPSCGAKRGRRIFGGTGKLGVVQDTLDNHKRMCVTIKSDKWPKDKYGRPVVYSRSQEREVLKQVYIESQGGSSLISPYDH